VFPFLFHSLIQSNKKTAEISHFPFTVSPLLSIGRSLVGVHGVHARWGKAGPGRRLFRLYVFHGGARTGGGDIWSVFCWRQRRPSSLLHFCLTSGSNELAHKAIGHRGRRPLRRQEAPYGGTNGGRRQCRGQRRRRCLLACRGAICRHCDCWLFFIVSALCSIVACTGQRSSRRRRRGPSARPCLPAQARCQTLFSYLNSDFADCLPPIMQAVPRHRKRPLWDRAHPPDLLHPGTMNPRRVFRLRAAPKRRATQTTRRPDLRSPMPTALWCVRRQPRPLLHRRSRARATGRPRRRHSRAAPREWASS